MKKVFLGPVAIAAIAALSVLATFAHASEGYFYYGTSSRGETFYLIGGQYSLYVYAHRPIKGYAAPETKSCLFNGDLQRAWPTRDAMHIGSAIPISTIVPYKLGPKPINLPAGLYHLFVATLTDCDWKFMLFSTNQNSAGLAPVTMFRKALGHIEFSTASLNDLVQFDAQFRTEHDADVPVSGIMQLLHDGQVVRTIPLKTGHDTESSASAFFADIRWEPGDARYLGKNEVKFIVKIGATEFTSTGEFTLTQ